MLVGECVRLRPFREKELDLVETWIEHREQGIGAHQPYVLGQGAMLRKALSAKLEPTEQRGFLAIEVIDGAHCIGFVRYTFQPVVQDSIEYYDIGYAIANPIMRGKGYAVEACGLLVEYLFNAYPIERIGAMTVPENESSTRLLARLGFALEGTLRRVLFFDGCWHDVALYGILRDEWVASRPER